MGSDSGSKACLPIRVKPTVDEAMLSWLLRLATRLRVSSCVARQTFGINEPSSTVAVVVPTEPETVRG